MNDFKMLIGDEWTESSSREWMDVINPATLEIVGRVPKGTRQDADAALQSATVAFPDWACRPAKARSQIIKQAVAKARGSLEEIACLLTQEQGKPLKESRIEVNWGLETLEYMAEEGYRILGEIVPTDSRERLSFVILQPVGVVAAIVPWNFPINLFCWKLGPALTAGCTVVAKPASQTPLSTLLLARGLIEGGLPPGVLNVVTGPGSTAGQELVDSPLSKKISFTGSTEMGKAIMRDSAVHLKKVGLELGGNCPLIVLRDANLDEAIPGTVDKAFRNAGQICNSINRVYVEAPIYEEFVDRLVVATAKLTIGNGLKNPEVKIGPMIDEPARKRVREHIQDALAKGAVLRYGGKEPKGEEFARGYFFEPTVLANVNHDMRVMREETFGPVAPVMPVADFEEAIGRANDSPYGLVGYIYTTDMAKAVEAGRRMECGSVGINETSFFAAPYPYPAWKESGTGVELSRHGLREYLKIKHVRLRLTG